MLAQNAHMEKTELDSLILTITNGKGGSRGIGLRVLGLGIDIDLDRQYKTTEHDNG